LLVVVAATRGYPLSHLSIVGVVLSAVLLWLGSLSVLGVAIFMSVVFRSVIGSVLATALAVYLMFVLPGPLPVDGISYLRHLRGVGMEAHAALLLDQRGPVHGWELRSH
jgi:hypothetical protein